MENNRNIVEILKAHHKLLIGEVNAIFEVTEELNGSGDGFIEIDKLLKDFASDLGEHLSLENNIFYVNLLDRMRELGQDTSNTEVFIEEMKGIEKVVIAFLKKFDNPEAIEKNTADFKKEFPVIKDTLLLRIESEESGVYEYWLNIDKK